MVTENEIEKVPCRTNKNWNDCMAKKVKLKCSETLKATFLLWLECQVDNQVCHSVGAAAAASFKFKTMTVQQSLNSP